MLVKGGMGNRTGVSAREAGCQDVAHGHRWPAEQAFQGGIHGGELALAAGEEQAQEHVGLRLGHAAGDQARPPPLVGDGDAGDRAPGEFRGDRCEAGEVEGG